MRSNITVILAIVCVFAVAMIIVNQPTNDYTPPTPTYAKFVHEYNSTEITFCNEYGITEQAYVRSWRDDVLFCVISPETCEVYNESN